MAATAQIAKRDARRKTMTTKKVEYRSASKTSGQIHEKACRPFKLRSLVSALGQVSPWMYSIHLRSRSSGSNCQVIVGRRRLYYKQTWLFNSCVTHFLIKAHCAHPKRKCGDGSACNLRAFRDAGIGARPTRVTQSKHRNPTENCMTMIQRITKQGFPHLLSPNVEHKLTDVTKSHMQVRVTASTLSDLQRMHRRKLRDVFRRFNMVRV